MILTMDQLAFQAMYGLGPTVVLFVTIVALVRYAMLIPYYIKTGNIGDVEDSFSFQLLGVGFDSFVDFSESAALFFTAKNPAGIAIDAILIGLALLIFLLFVLSLLSVYYVSFPAIIILSSVIYFARKARAKYAAKEEFSNRLRGIGG